MLAWLRLLPWILFLVFALRELELPGLYMDEINHGAFVPAMFDKAAADKPHFRLPANILGDQSRFPILGGSFYNVTLKAYLAAPLYRFFGYTVLTHRLFEVLVAGGMLFLFFRLAQRLFPGPVTSYALTSALAIDPLLTFQMRSQASSFVLLMVPVLGFLIILHAAWSHRRLSTAQAILAGFCAAVAGMCYFVGAIVLMVPWLALAVFARRSRRLWVLIVSSLLFASPYFYSLISVQLQSPALLHNGGIPQFALDAQSRAHPSVLGRLQSGGAEFIAYLSTTRPLQYASVKNLPGGETKSWLLVCALFFLLADVAFAMVAGQAARTRALQRSIVILAPLACLLLLLSFVPSIDTHHLFSTLPLVYLAVGCCADRFASWSLPWHRPALGWVLALIIPVFLMAISIPQQREVVRALREHGGSGLFNERVSQLPMLKSQLFPKSAIVFADWGFHLPYLFLTEGRMPYAVRMNEPPERWLPRELGKKRDLVVCSLPKRAANIAAVARLQKAKVEISLIRGRDNVPIYAFIHMKLPPGPDASALLPPSTAGRKADTPPDPPDD